MTREEYQQEMQQIDDMIEQLRKSKKSVTSTYIENNRVFKDGDKVAVYDGSRHMGDGLINGYEVFYDGHIHAIVHQIKKDGTMSTRRIYTWHSYTLNKIN